MALEVLEHDNRGSEDEPYGFLYFNDGCRMAYALGKLHPDATGGWEPLSTRHVQPALEYAKEHGLITEG